MTDGEATIDTVRRIIADLLGELMDGAGTDVAWVLNPGDRGLLASLDVLSADAASAQRDGRSSVAAHVDHLRYGLGLLNRWAAGQDDPAVAADYSASWSRQRVSEAEWRVLREALAREAHALREAVLERREMDRAALTAFVASVVHLAYHLGAIRQINASAAGPPAND